MRSLAALHSGPHAILRVCHPTHKRLLRNAPQKHGSKTSSREAAEPSKQMAGTVSAFCRVPSGDGGQCLVPSPRIGPLCASERRLRCFWVCAVRYAAHQRSVDPLPAHHWDHWKGGWRRQPTTRCCLWICIARIISGSRHTFFLFLNGKIVSPGLADVGLKDTLCCLLRTEETLHTTACAAGAKLPPLPQPWPPRFTRLANWRGALRVYKPLWPLAGPLEYGALFPWRHRPGPLCMLSVNPRFQRPRASCPRSSGPNPTGSELQSRVIGRQ